MTHSLLCEEVQKCVRCGACKTLCPTYHLTLNETMGARGRVALLGELCLNHLPPSKNLAEKIFSCMLCGACKGICPTGINIPEMIYQGRGILKKAYRKGFLSKKALKITINNMDTVLPVMRWVHMLLYQPFQKTFGLSYLPKITGKPFNKHVQVYKNMKKVGRVAIFTGCNVNYFYPHLGDALSHVLLAKGYEVVVFKGEECCGAPLRSMGLEEEASQMARRNVDHFSKVRAEAIISLCPTCTMVIKEQYPQLVGDSISNIMDINEFMLQSDLTKDLAVSPQVVTYHDPCHLSFGLGIKKEPRKILNAIEGLELKEMKHPDECCGFAGLFSLHFRDMAKTLTNTKMENIHNTAADTVVTSCPGCIMQLEAMQQKSRKKVRIRHIVEVIDEAMHREAQ